MSVTTRDTIQGRNPPRLEYYLSDETDSDSSQNDSSDGDSSDDNYAFDSSDEIIDAPMPLPCSYSLVNALPHFYRASPATTLLAHEFRASEGVNDLTAFLRDWPHEIRCISLPWGLRSAELFQTGSATGLYCRTIRMIYLRRCDLDARSLGRLLKLIPQLVHLRLEDCMHVNPDTLNWPLRWHQGSLQTVTLERQAIEQDPEALAVAAALVDGLIICKDNRLFCTIHIYHTDLNPWP